MLKCIIVDDELKSRESLNLMLTNFCEGIEVVAMCENVSESLQAIEKLEPDLLMLDVQLQNETGFDLLSKVPNINFDVIFTTAYSEYAIKAMRFSAIDYLLKPIDLTELLNAIGNAKKKKNGKSVERVQNLMHTMNSTKSENPKLALPTSSGLIFIKIKDVIYCKASGNYTEIIMNDGKKYLVSRQLKEYDDLLSEHDFFRIHHSSLINLNFIESYIKGEGGSVVMTNNETLDVSRRKKEVFLERIGYRG